MQDESFEQWLAELKKLQDVLCACLRRPGVLRAAEQNTPGTVAIVMRSMLLAVDDSPDAGRLACAAALVQQSHDRGSGFNPRVSLRYEDERLHVELLSFCNDRHYWYADQPPVTSSMPATLTACDFDMARSHAWWQGNGSAHSFAPRRLSC